MKNIKTNTSLLNNLRDKIDIYGPSEFAKTLIQDRNVLYKTCWAIVKPIINNSLANFMLEDVDYFFSQDAYSIVIRYDKKINKEYFVIFANKKLKLTKILHIDKTSTIMLAINVDP